MFLHTIPVSEPPSLEPVFTPEGKFYRLPSGVLVPSVTSVIGKATNKTFLQHWKRKLGEEKADQITRQAAQRGTNTHALIERYLKGDEDYAKDVFPFDVSQFNKIRPLLDSSIEEIYGIEYPLYHQGLLTAGTADLLCRWKGRSTVVDFKTSIRLKKEAWIEGYFLQAATYAIMASSQLGLEDVFSRIVIVIMVDHEEPQVFERSAYDYARRVKQIFIDDRGDFHRATTTTQAPETTTTTP